MKDKNVKRAVIQASVLSLLCPHCGEPQPDPEAGSDMWMPEQVTKADGSTRVCVSCDQRFIVFSSPRVLVERSLPSLS